MNNMVIIQIIMVIMLHHLSFIIQNNTNLLFSISWSYLIHGPICAHVGLGTSFNSTNTFEGLGQKKNLINTLKSSFFQHIGSRKIANLLFLNYFENMYVCIFICLFVCVLFCTNMHICKYIPMVHD